MFLCEILIYNDLLQLSNKCATVNRNNIYSAIFIEWQITHFREVCLFKILM